VEHPVSPFDACAHNARARVGTSGRADQVERWPIDRLIPYAKNSRTHSEAQIAQLAASMKEWGWANPVLADEAGGVIAIPVENGGASLISARPALRRLNCRCTHLRDRLDPTLS